MDEIISKLQPYAKEIGAALLVVLLAIIFLGGKKAAEPVLHPTEWRNFKLVKKTQLTHNTARYRFGLPKETDCLGLPIGQHISIQANIDGKNVMRSYTPTSLDNDKGYFELVVKTYPQGNISKYLAGLKEGDSVQVRGPKGKFVYEKNLSPHLLMIAGGTGITPMFQIIKSSLADPTDKTQLALVYANVEETDILLRQELDQLAAASNGRLKIYHVLNKVPASWAGGEGFITKEIIANHMHNGGVASGSKVLLCGPPPMMTAMKNHLKEIGYPAPRAVSKLEDQVFLF
jgi:cytochrome-b5 reductase